MVSVKTQAAPIESFSIAARNFSTLSFIFNGFESLIAENSRRFGNLNKTQIFIGMSRMKVAYY